jgi:AcrR family transcriptional regulator
VTSPRRAARPRKPGRPAGATGDRTRERVLEAAVETFARQGLDGTSVRDIARHARIRVSTLYHYFPSKDALYHEVQERVHATVRDLVLAALGDGSDLREAVRAAVGRLFELLVHNRAWVQLGARTSLENPLGAGADHRIADRWIGLIEATLEPARRRGAVKAIDPILFMITIDALVHWHILHDALYRRVLGAGLDDPDVVARARDHVVAVALRTLGLE